jgi:hypothetical protein
MSALSIHSSSSSSVDTQLRTPLFTATSGFDLPVPSPDDLPPADLDKLKHTTTPINIPGPHRRSPSVSSSSSDDLRPIVVQRLDAYLNVPPSPPIIDPHYLLGQPMHPNPANQHSIAAPFANLNPSPTNRNAPVMSTSPLRRRQIMTGNRRPSALAHELGKLDIDTGGNPDFETDPSCDDPESPVLSPLSRQ